MSEDLLDHADDRADVTPALEEQRGEGDAQAVGRDALARQIAQIGIAADGLADGISEHEAYRARAHPGGSLTDEEKGNLVALDEERTGVVEVATHRRHRPWCDREDAASLGFLAVDAQLVALEVELMEGEIDEALNPATRRQGDRQQGQVAHPHRPVLASRGVLLDERRRGLDEGCRFLQREVLLVDGVRLRRAGRHQMDSRIMDEVPAPPRKDHLQKQRDQR